MKKPKLSLEDFSDAPFAKKPSLSHDGKKAAFISNATGIPQVYVADVLRKTTKQLTKGNDPVTFCAFSPTSEILVYGKSHAGNEQTQLYLICSPRSAGTEEKITPHNFAQYRFGAWSPNGARIVYTSNERNGIDFDAFVYDIKNKRRKCIQRGEGVWEAVLFSPSGSQLVLQKTVAPRIHELYLTNLRTGKLQRLFSSRFQSQYRPVVWRRNGKKILLRTDERSEFVHLIMYDVETKRSRPFLARAADIEVAELSPDEKYLAVVWNERGRSRLMVYHFPDGEIYANDIAPACVIGHIQWSPDSSSFVFDAAGADSPAVLWIYRVKERSLERLVEHSLPLPTRSVVKPILRTYRSFDGLRIPLYCFYPKRVKSRKRGVPALVFIHGGPDEQYRGLFSPLIQYLVHQGIAVFVPNIRGSSGYGKTFLQLDDGRKKIDALREVAALARYIKKQKRFLLPAIMGMSYGGYVALAQLAFYPKLWSAGISSSGISNFLTYLKSTASWRKKLREKEYGSIKKDKVFLQSISPTTFARRIKSPVLLIHGKNDTRVPVSETLQIAEILRRQSVRVETLLLKDEGHRIRKQANLLTVFRKIEKFLCTSVFSFNKNARTSANQRTLNLKKTPRQ